MPTHVLGGLDSREGRMERRYEQLADGVILAGVLFVVGFVIYLIAMGFS